MTDLIRVSEAAEIGQVSVQTIRNLIKRGNLTGRKIDETRRNSPLRLSRAEVEQYFQSAQLPQHDQSRLDVGEQN